MTRSLVFPPCGRLGAVAARMSAVAVLSLALPAPVLAVDLTYHVTTSAPDGRAVCAVKGSLKKGSPTQVDAALTPTAGEGFLNFTIVPKGPSAPASVGGQVGAGTQAGCDIFPNSPTSVSSQWSGAAGTLLGILDLHAHPGADCASAGVAEGTLTLSAGTTVAKLRPLICDTSGSHANLSTRVLGDTTGTKGQVMSQDVTIVNHGPADATNATFTAKFPKTLLVVGASMTKGVCHLDTQKNTANCALGAIPSLNTADISLFTIPVKDGAMRTTFAVGADNNGALLPTKATIRSDVAKGNNAILNVTVKCKGAAGSVTINPNGTGGTTTCTCPDPADATRDTVGCLETYAQATTVTLTPTATTGQFNKWTGACAGNPGACGLTLDPAAQNPDKNTTAKFK